MTSRQFDTAPPAATAERTPTRQPQAPEGEHVHAARRNPLVPGGGRLARAGAALLQLQRDLGNRYVQEVVRQARQDEAAVGAAGGELDADLRRDLDAARHGGRRLDGTVGARLGQALGSDFSTVKVHTDARADALTRSLRASAFTAGGDIFFRKGAYAPHTSGGRELLAHELTHVAQQGGPAGTGAAAGVTVGPADDRHEREADRVASDLAGQRSPRAPAPAEGGGVPAVQRRYLNQPQQQGYADWLKDTNLKKGSVLASRKKLAQVDLLLWGILAAKASPQWMQVGEPMLKRLEDALNKTKYDQGATKTSAAFKKRRDAVVRLQNEVQSTLSQVMIKNILVGAGNLPTTQPVQQPFDQQAYLDALMQQGLLVPQVPQQAQQVPQQAQQVPQQVSQQAQQVPQQVPQVLQQAQQAQQVQQVPQQAQQAQPDPVAELEKVGFVRTYLTSLPTVDLDLLFEAHEALGAKDLPRAQLAFDTLNPPEASSGKSLPGFWEQEAWESSDLVTTNRLRFDFKRTKDELLAAQRQLIAYHAEDIGGEYGKLLSYKPYKKQALTPQEVQEGQKYFNPGQLRDWSTTIEKGQGYELTEAKAEVHAIAAEATLASEARSKAKGRQPKAAKEPLSEAEVTALRIYTADEYREMNAVFRDFRVDQPTVNWEKYSAIAKLAISGLGKLPKARDTTSYRGDYDIKWSGHAGVLRFGATFTLPNFYSTTMKPEKAFPGDLGYVFHNKRGGRIVEKFSAFKTEAEVLIPPGVKFKISGEFHLQNDGSWLSHDGASGLSAAAKLFWDNDAEKASRKTILEFTEV
jgi:Domain of unknown function (DUF4157)/ADP-ribosyltransferase exoenzyme